VRGAGKHGRVVRLHSRQWDVGQRDGAGLRRIRGGDGAAALIGRIGTCWTLER